MFKAFIITTALITSTYSFASSMDQVIKKIESMTRSQLTSIPVEIKGVNDDCRVSANLVDSMPRIYLKTFNRHTYKIDSRDFSPKRESECDIISKGSKLVVTCLDQECEEQGCVDTKYEMELARKLISIQGLSCEF